MTGFGFFHVLLTYDFPRTADFWHSDFFPRIVGNPTAAAAAQFLILRVPSQKGDMHAAQEAFSLPKEYIKFHDPASGDGLRL